MNKGWLLDTDGTKSDLVPENGKIFTMEEVQKLIETDMVQLKECPQDTIMLMDEEGKFKNKPVNQLATMMVWENLLAGDFIVGKVIYCHKGMFK